MKGTIKPLNILAQLSEAVFSLVYPKVCAACKSPLLKNEQAICIPCQFELPKARFHHLQDNPVERKFHGRCNIAAATAYYVFQKGGRVQQVLHHIKYEGQKEVGFLIGQWMGTELSQTAPYKTIDLVVPVPLHKDKLKKRGYNQSEWFGKGLAKSMACTLSTGNLLRHTASATQTRKSRYVRWKNVETIFKVQAPETFGNKHILLVDDVVTTGATLEACAHELLKIPGTKVSIATMAYAG